jgi:hypothetical protein
MGLTLGLLALLACGPRTVTYGCWPDADGDGWGDRDAATLSCSLSGVVGNNEDCDDGDPEIGPCQREG